MTFILNESAGDIIKDVSSASKIKRKILSFSVSGNYYDNIFQATLVLNKT